MGLKIRSADVAPNTQICQSDHYTVFFVLVSFFFIVLDSVTVYVPGTINTPAHETPPVFSPWARRFPLFRILCVILQAPSGFPNVVFAFFVVLARHVENGFRNVLRGNDNTAKCLAIIGFRFLAVSFFSECNVGTIVNGSDCATRRSG